VDPEGALRGTNAKFERRFAAIEAALARRGRTAAEANASLAEMEALWDGGEDTRAVSALSARPRSLRLVAA
jgi:ATP diphosphatase